MEYSSVSCLPVLSYGKLPGETTTCIALQFLCLKRDAVGVCKGISASLACSLAFSLENGVVQVAGDHTEIMRKEFKQNLVSVEIN